MGGDRYIEWTTGAEAGAQLGQDASGDVRLSDDHGASVLVRVTLAPFLRGLVEVVQGLAKSGKAIVDVADERGGFVALRDGEGFEMDYERTTLRYTSLDRFTAALADAIDGYLGAIGAASTPVIEELRDFAARHVSS